MPPPTNQVEKTNQILKTKDGDGLRCRIDQRRHKNAEVHLKGASLCLIALLHLLKCCKSMQSETNPLLTYGRASQTGERALDGETRRTFRTRAPASGRTELQEKRQLRGCRATPQSISITARSCARKKVRCGGRRLIPSAISHAVITAAHPSRARERTSGSHVRANESGTKDPRRPWTPIFTLPLTTYTYMYTKGFTRN